MVNVVKLKLSPELHSRFRKWAFDRGTTMQSALVESVVKMCGGERLAVALEGVKSKSATPTKSTEPKKGRKCDFCPEVVEKWENVNGFVVCESCQRKSK